MTEDLPAAQFKHVLDVEAPTVAEYVPAPQSTQPAPPREYLPARQFTQSVDELAPVAEDLPAWQLKHVLIALAPTVSEYFPVPQSLHATEPVVSLYLPVGHAVHADAGSPVNPTMHLLQSLMLDEFEADVEFPGHKTHNNPSTVLYLPSRQSEEHVPSCSICREVLETESPVTI